MGVRLLYKAGLLTAVTSVGAVYAFYEAEVFNTPWFSSLRAVRFGRASYAAFRVSLDYKWSLNGLDPESPHYRQTMSEIHLHSAKRLQKMCSQNGGLFIKVGQHVGALQYLLPQEYVQTFKVFHSEAPVTPLPRMKQVIEEELGRPVDEIFSELDKDPLGAASLAQCHRGVLKENGRVVAVKIQHPDVRKNAYTDMDTMDFLVACVSWLFPDFHFRWLAEETRRNLPHELDFSHEAGNQEKCAAMLHHLTFMKVPKVYWSLTTPRVLTMEFCEGGKVDNLTYIRTNSISADEVTLKLGRMYSEMIFLHGFIHCDPHPGNVLVRAGEAGKAEIVLLDHGLYTQLTDDFRLTYCNLWRALLQRDQAAIKQYCLALNAKELYPLLACMITARDWGSIQSGLVNNSQRSHSELRAIRSSIPIFLAEITQLLDTVPRQLVLILKTNDLLRGIEHVLGSRVQRQSYLTMSKYCLWAIGKHEEQTARSWTQWALCRTRTNLSILFVRLYETWLWWKAVLSL